MTDREVLRGYVDVWWSAVGDFTALLDDVPDEQWTTPTDLAGWDVRACAAHVAHLESVLAGGLEESAELGQDGELPPHVTGMMGLYTEIGVVNRLEAAPAEILAEIRDSTTRRREALLADPPEDASARPPVTLGGMPWSWGTLLRNRPLDVFMHEQDVRRAVGRPGNLHSAAGDHTTSYLAGGFGFVLAKRGGAPAGTTAVLTVDDDAYAFEVGDDGRGRRLTEAPAHVQVALHTDRESFLVLAGGRRTPAHGAVRIDGDRGLGEHLLTVMATTP